MGNFAWFVMGKFMESIVWLHVMWTHICHMLFKYDEPTATKHSASFHFIYSLQFTTNTGWIIRWFMGECSCHWKLKIGIRMIQSSFSLAVATDAQRCSLTFLRSGWIELVHRGFCSLFTCFTTHSFCLLFMSGNSSAISILGISDGLQCDHRAPSALESFCDLVCDLFYERIIITKCMHKYLNGKHALPMSARYNGTTLRRQNVCNNLFSFAAPIQMSRWSCTWLCLGWR